MYYFVQVPIIELCKTFFNKIYSRDEFEELFAHKIDKDEMTQNMYEFLIERLGGPLYYSERKDLPMIIRRHAHVRFSDDQCKLWLDLMADSLNDHRTSFNEEIAQALLKYFSFMVQTIKIYFEDANFLYDRDVN